MDRLNTNGTRPGIIQRQYVPASCTVRHRSLAAWGCRTDERWNTQQPQGLPEIWQRTLATLSGWRNRYSATSSVYHNPTPMMTAMPLMTDEAAIALPQQAPTQSGGFGVTRHVGPEKSGGTCSLRVMHVTMAELAAGQGAGCDTAPRTLCASDLAMVQPYVTMHVNQFLESTEECVVLL